MLLFEIAVYYSCDQIIIFYSVLELIARGIIIILYCQTLNPSVVSILCNNFFSLEKMASHLSGQILCWRMVTCQCYCFKNTEFRNSVWALAWVVGNCISNSAACLLILWESVLPNSPIKKFFCLWTYSVLITFETQFLKLLFLELGFSARCDW